MAGTVGRVAGRWTDAQVTAALGVTGRGEDHAFGGITTDSRRILAGDLFLALKGDRYDAHAFLDEARQRGAAAAVVRRGTTAIAGLPFYEVDDTTVALGLLGRARRRRLSTSTPVVAVTGSSGKTSTKELLRAALSARYRVHATSENLNNRIGVPLTLLATPEDAEAVVVEAGASVPGEIAVLRGIIEPSLAVITNVGYAHVEGFGSLAGVLAEKVTLVEGVPVAVVGTEPAALAEETRKRTRTIVAGTSAAAQVRPEAVQLDVDGHPRLRWMGAEVTVPLLGRHQADNAMLALAAAREAGVDPRAAMDGLAGARAPEGRGVVRQIGGLTVIDDSYNANPSSLARAVEFADWYARERQRPLVVVVGSMLELGPESATLHAAAANDIVARGPAVVAAVGAFADAFAPHREILGDRLVSAPDAERLGPRLKAVLRGDEVVLLKASRGVALERVLRHLT